MKAFDEIKELTLLEWCIISCIAMICVSILISIVTGEIIKEENKEMKKTTQNIFKITKDGSIIDTIIAKRTSVDNSGTLLFSNYDCELIAAFSNGSWDFVELVGDYETE